MYISILIKINNHRIGFLLSLCKEVQECDKLYRNLAEAKIQLWGPYTIIRIFGTIISFCDSDAERQFAFADGGYWSDHRFNMDHFYKVQSLHCIQKEVLIQFLVPYSVLNCGQQTEKGEERKRSSQKKKHVFGSLENNDVQSIMNKSIVNKNVCWKMMLTREEVRLDMAEGPAT